MKEIKDRKVASDIYYFVLSYLDKADVVKSKPLCETNYEEFVKLANDALNYFLNLA